MRSLWFMPMTYLAGIHGFAYFVPYLMIVALLAMLLSQARRARQAVAVVASTPILELETAAA